MGNKSSTFYYELLSNAIISLKTAIFCSPSPPEAKRDRAEARSLTEAPNIEHEAEESDGFNAATLLPIALIVVLGAGGAYYFLKVRKRKPDTSGTTDLDDYDFPEDDEDEVK